MSQGSKGTSSSSSSSSGGTKLSIIVPTYKEVANIPVLCERVFKELATAGLVAEMIIVDDNSADGSKEKVDELTGKGYDIKILVRTTQRGLSSAVLAGFTKAANEVLVVMDADLQHDPKYLPALVAPVISRDADFTVGSRNIQGGGIKDFPLHRRLISWVATVIALPLANCSDPMSGFFSLRKETLSRATTLNPLGYKIGLELMVRCQCKAIREIPIVFGDREAGESKLSMKQNILYLLHVTNLYFAVYGKEILFFILFVFAALMYIVKTRFL